MDWDKLRVFYVVAKAGSFTRATKDLNISQSALSRQVSILEDELEAQLFTRVPRGVVLTSAGQDLYTTVTNVFAKLERAQTTIAELKIYPRGHLRIATEQTFGSLWLAPRLQEFLDRYPEVRVTLFLKEEETDLNMRKADVGITSLLPQNKEIVSYPLASYPYRLYASRTYLQNYGVPQKAEDLDHHQLIVFGKEFPHLYSHLDWLLTVGAQTPRIPTLVVNNGQALLEATRAGLGIAALHRYSVGEDPEIVEILPECQGPQVTQYALYPTHLVGLKRIQVFLNFLAQKMKEEDF